MKKIFLGLMCAFVLAGCSESKSKNLDTDVSNSVELVDSTSDEKTTEEDLQFYENFQADGQKVLNYYESLLPEKERLYNEGDVNALSFSSEEYDELKSLYLDFKNRYLMVPISKMEINSYEDIADDMKVLKEYLGIITEENSREYRLKNLKWKDSLENYSEENKDDNASFLEDNKTYNGTRDSMDEEIEKLEAEFEDAVASGDDKKISEISDRLDELIAELKAELNKE